MKEIRTEIEIDAPLQKVWNILIDFDHWKNWNPISQASGAASVGSKLSISMLSSESKSGHTYRPIVIELEAPRLLHWRGAMMAGFLFTNDKIFELKETTAGTQLIHREVFTGILVPMFWSKLNQFVSQMLKSMNDALKREAEK